MKPPIKILSPLCTHQLLKVHTRANFWTNLSIFNAHNGKNSAKSKEKSIIKQDTRLTPTQWTIITVTTIKPYQTQSKSETITPSDHHSNIIMKLQPCQNSTHGNYHTTMEIKITTNNKTWLLVQRL